MEIIVIGPEPPCIRCKTTFKVAQQVASRFGEGIAVRRISTESEEAKRYGNVEGGHTIAEMENVEHDHEGIEKLLGQIDQVLEQQPDAEAAVKPLMDEIENKLTPIKQKAQERGYLMTPVVVVNGQVKAVGYVPKAEEFQEWIRSELEPKGQN
ncbi:MAG: thioredoxin family protein [Clostridia bacterium]|jgi:hypothetical protein|nr:thioredoxin family protein [Clostridia bacterium]MDH7573114.1 thioredoxin family protein [Clostridia bacterium]